MSAPQGGGGKRKLAAGCGVLIALPVLACAVFIARRSVWPGGVERYPGAARAVVAQESLMGEARRLCPIEARAFDEGRVHADVARLWADRVRSSASEDYAVRANVRFMVSASDGSPGFRPSYVLAVRASMTRVPAPPPDRRYIVPVPLDESWTVRNFSAESCVTKPAPSGWLGLLWAAYWGD